MRAAAIALFLALPPWLHAQQPVPPSPTAPTIKLPAKVTVAAGALGKLKAETTANAVKWVVLTPGLSAEPIDNGRTLFCAGLPGTYDLIAYTAAGDVPSDPARVTVVIGDPPAPPPPPLPHPPDPLRAKLAAAFASAFGAPEQKREWAKDLAALYRAAAKLSADSNVTTAGTLKAKLTAAAGALIGPDALTEVRKVVALELAVLLPIAEAELTPVQRAAVAALFTKLASRLEAIAQ